MYGGYWLQVQFLPTPSARRATTAVYCHDCARDISTHALREEGDGLASPPRAFLGRFLPTPSARRATLRRNHAGVGIIISTHALREEGDLNKGTTVSGAGISTHALREEGDAQHGADEMHRRISTHALREEGDLGRQEPLWPARHFYPRPPRGGRPLPVATVKKIKRFLPTPSARRATHRAAGHPRRAGISTHALREEGDIDPIYKVLTGDDFYPRPPRGGRRGHGYPRPRRPAISTHALREEGDSPVL